MLGPINTNNDEERAADQGPINNKRWLLGCDVVWDGMGRRFTSHCIVFLLCHPKCFTTSPKMDGLTAAASGKEEPEPATEINEND